jgi:hypothetical protein
MQKCALQMLVALSAVALCHENGKSSKRVGAKDGNENGGFGCGKPVPALPC